GLWRRLRVRRRLRLRQLRLRHRALGVPLRTDAGLPLRGPVRLLRAVGAGELVLPPDPQLHQLRVLRRPLLQPGYRLRARPPVLPRRAALQAGRAGRFPGPWLPGGRQPRLVLPPAGEPRLAGLSHGPRRCPALGGDRGPVPQPAPGPPAGFRTDQPPEPSGFWTECSADGCMGQPAGRRLAAGPGLPWRPHRSQRSALAAAGPGRPAAHVRQRPRSAAVQRRASAAAQPAAVAAEQRSAPAAEQRPAAAALAAGSGHPPAFVRKPACPAADRLAAPEQRPATAAAAVPATATGSAPAAAVP